MDKLLSVFEFDIKGVEINMYPVIGYSPSAGLSLGFTPIIVFPISPSSTRINRPSVVSAYFTYSTMNWLRGHVDAKIFGNNMDLTIFTDFNLFHDRFYGIGVKGQSSKYATYATQYINVSGDLTKVLSNKVSVGGTFDINYTRNTSTSDTFSMGEYMPEADAAVVAGLGPVFIHDNRDDVYYATKGTYIKTSAQYYPSLGPNKFTYSRFFLDVRKYYGFGKDWVFALQSYNDYMYGNIPFYKMAKIGTYTLLRGFSHRSKYIDSKISMVQAEIRKWLFWRVGMTAFGGVGNVFDKGWQDFQEDVKYVGGLGLRFRIRANSKINMRADYGFASNGDRSFFLTIREAF